MQNTGFNVLFICSGNSARSIFAEALLRDLGRGRFNAFSAGTRPGTTLNPVALAVLERNGHATGDLRSKHIGDFQQPDRLRHGGGRGMPALARPAHHRPLGPA